MRPLASLDTAAPSELLPSLRAKRRNPHSGDKARLSQRTVAARRRPCPGLLGFARKDGCLWSRAGRGESIRHERKAIARTACRVLAPPPVPKRPRHINRCSSLSPFSCFKRGHRGARHASRLHRPNCRIAFPAVRRFRRDGDGDNGRWPHHRRALRSARWRVWVPRRSIDRLDGTIVAGRAFLLDHKTAVGIRARVADDDILELRSLASAARCAGATMLETEAGYGLARGRSKRD